MEMIVKKFLRFLCKMLHLPVLVTIYYELPIEPIEETLRVFVNRKELKKGKGYSYNKENRSITLS